jgi:hypothetical protein
MGGSPSRYVLGLSAIDADLALLQAVRGRGELTARDLATIFGAEVRAMGTAIDRLHTRGWLDRSSAHAGSPDTDSWSLNDDGADVRRRLLVDEALDAAKRLAIDRAHAVLSPLDGLVRELRDSAGGSPRSLDDDDDHRTTPTIEYELHTRAERVVAHLAARAPRFGHHGVRLTNNDPLGLVRTLAGSGHPDSYALAWTDLVRDVQSSIDDRTTVGLIRHSLDAHPSVDHSSPC